MRSAAALALAAVLTLAGTARAQGDDTAAVPLRGPTVVACFERVSQARVDADEALATVMDDFSWHWSEAVDSLRAHGIATHSRGSRWVKLRTDG
ncbi:MAG TPA: hypothetical protein VF771_00985, partial [Longimicrobiaceae bacterium]